MHGWMLDDCVKLYNVNPGLHISRLETVEIDHALVTALVARWFQETHTFHLPVDEVLITL